MSIRGVFPGKPQNPVNATKSNSTVRGIEMSAKYALRCVIILLTIVSVTAAAEKGEPAREKRSKKQEFQADHPSETYGSGEIHIVLLFSDHYSPAKTMPPVAKEWADKYGLKVTFLGMDSNRENMPGLEALADADLVVMFMRWRGLPEEQFNKILNYVNAGKPVVGLRTATHAIRYPTDNPLSKWNEKFCLDLFGQKWLSHAKYDKVAAAKGAEGHPILKDVEVDRLDTGDLYQLLPLPKEIEPVLVGKRDEVECPVLWTWTPKGGRVVYTSFGRQNDFNNPQFKRMLLNTLFWAMDKPLPDAKETSK